MLTVLPWFLALRSGRNDQGKPSQRRRAGPFHQNQRDRARLAEHAAAAWYVVPSIKHHVSKPNK